MSRNMASKKPPLLRKRPSPSTIQLGTLATHPELAKKHEEAALLLKNIKEQLPELEKLLAAADDHWGIEDGVYRFYHQSFKSIAFRRSLWKSPKRLRSYWQVINSTTGLPKS